MKLKSKKKLIARISKVGAGRVWVDPNKIGDVKEAITREDLRGLLREGVIMIKQKKGSSRGRARIIIEQKRQGRRKGRGTKKGKKFAKTSRKRRWVITVRGQREFVKELKEKGLISTNIKNMLRQKVGGGFFRSRRHIKLFLTERGLWSKKDDVQNQG